MKFAAEVRLAEVQFRHLKSKLNKLKSLKFRFGTRRPAVSKRVGICRVIHKSLRNFRPLRYSSRDGHAEGEHVNRGRDTPSFCPTLQVLDMSTLGDAADVNPVIKFLQHTLTSAASSRVDISSNCKVGQKFGVSLPLLTCSPSAWPSRLLYRRGRKSRRYLWINQYFQPWKYSLKKKPICKASEQLRREISNNFKHYHNCDLCDWKNYDDKETQTAAGCAPGYQYPKKW